jgi:AraC family transcriptional regulator of adaptative response / DNA-3-methyladenine glycosylase II
MTTDSVRGDADSPGIAEAGERQVPDEARDAFYAAVIARDTRFDGVFVFAVATTGIYCRPGCPARSPLRVNTRFFGTATAARAAGFRACRRCRPEAGPGLDGGARSDLASRALELIGDGVVDRDGVAGLAARLGYSERQLRRALVAELGAGPVALARARRARAAHRLLTGTALPATDVAFAAGFASIRQFNATIRAVYGATPGDLRAATAPAP